MIVPHSIRHDQKISLEGHYFNWKCTEVEFLISPTFCTGLYSVFVDTITSHVLCLSISNACKN